MVVTYSCELIQTICRYKPVKAAELFIEMQSAYADLEELNATLRVTIKNYKTRLLEEIENKQKADKLAEALDAYEYQRKHNAEGNSDWADQALKEYRGEKCEHKKTSSYTAGDPFIECNDCGAYKMYSAPKDSEWQGKK